MMLEIGEFNMATVHITKWQPLSHKIVGLWGQKLSIVYTGFLHSKNVQYDS